MTYWGVLLRFLVPALTVLLLIELARGLTLKHKADASTSKGYLIVLLHVVIALVYTTPWDNYLVAQAVWWYEPALVSGMVIGYVPVEEYAFFVLQTLLTGLWTLMLLRRDPAHDAVEINDAGSRWATSTFVALIGLAGAAALVSGWDPGRYLALILVWAALPVLIQTAFGGDILLSHWRTMIPGVMLPTIYLWVVDYLAIQAGTWTISTNFTTGVKVGVLPIEEMTFFFVTNWIVTAGVLLMLSPASRKRAEQWWQRVRRRTTPPGA